MKKVPEVVTWTVDTTCPDTTFVVLPDVVTHLTSDVLVVKGDPDAVSFEYSLSRPALGEDGDDDDGGSGGGSSGDDDDGGGTDNEAVGSQTGGDDSTGSSSAGGGEESVESDWLIGDSSGVIHLHHLQVCFRFCIGFSVQRSGKTLIRCASRWMGEVWVWVRCVVR